MYKIIEKEILNPTIIKMAVETPTIVKKALTGQFIILRIHGDGKRIPLTATGYDRERGMTTIIFQTVGKTTTLLNQLNVGNSILDFVGPPGKSSHVDGYKKICVVGGGAGCAIAYPTTRVLHKNGAEVTVVTEFRNKDLVILEEEFKQVSTHAYLVSDDGSTGVKGPIINMLEDLISKGESFDRVIVIRPSITVKFVYQLTRKYGIKTVVSTNPVMIDGIGMYGGHRLSVGGGVESACVDDPGFDDHLVNSDEAMSRGAIYRDFEAHARDAACNLANKEVR